MEEIDLTTEEDITLFTDDERVSVNKVNREFRQESKLKGLINEFTIFNDNQCYQKVIKKHGGRHKFRVNLSYLDPEPRRERKLADSWLVTAAISAILAFLLIYLGWFSDNSAGLHTQLLYILLCTTVSFSCIAFMIAILKTRDRLVIYSKCGRAPVLQLINNNPDRESFLKFMNCLSRHILLSRKNISCSATELLAMELKELRRLKDEGVINGSQYDISKQRIFSNKAFVADNAS